MNGGNFPSTPPRRIFWRVLLNVSAILVAASVVCTQTFAQPDVQATEYKVKAAFVYKFGSYVDWPPHVFEQPESPVVIGVAGGSVLVDELVAMVAERTINGRRIAIRRISRPDALGGVHILFVGADVPRAASFLAAAQGKPILTVTESEDAFAVGSIINLVVSEDRVRFDVALRQAEIAGLKISARLLPVARKIIAAQP